jgi:hypothetical protein
MPKLWIANTTKQSHDFVYRPRLRATLEKTEDGILKPVFGEQRNYMIPYAGQVCIGDKLSDAEIKNILDQRQDVVDFQGLNRVRGFQGLCYRIGENEVPLGEIMERIETNDNVRTAQVKDRQQKSALEIATNLRSVSQTDDAPFKDLRETDVQVAQRADKEVNQGTPQMNQVVEVAESGKEPSGRGRRSA